MNTAKIGKRELNRQNNQKAIMQAARRCFSESGFDKVTVRDIIRQTGLASGTFYNYFPDKKSIFSALIDEYLERLTGHLNNFRGAAKSLEGFVNSAYMAIFTTVEQDPEVYQLVHANDKVVEEISGASIFGPALEALKEDINNAIENGAIASLNIDYVTASFTGVGAELGERLAERGGEPKLAAHFATKLLLGGLYALSEDLKA